MNPVIMHVNYGEVRWDSFGKNTVDDIFKMAVDIGFDGIELRGNPPKEFKELPFMDYMDQVVKAQKKYGIKTLLFGIQVENTISADKEERAAGVRKALEKAKIVNDLCGTTICNTFAQFINCPISTAPKGAVEFNGSAAATEEQWKLTVDSFQQVGKGLEPLGVKFALETHMNYIHDLPAPTRKLVDLIDCPNIGINMDYGNTVYFPDRPTLEEAIDIYGDKLFYLHLKNSMPVASGGRMATALSEGEINHRLYLKKLREVGFDGPIGIEAPRPGDRVWFAQKDLEYYKAVVASI